MHTSTTLETDLTVQSFAYVAKQLAQSSAALEPALQYEQILNAAEKHRSALRLMQRDVFECAEQELRKRVLTKAEFQRVRKLATQSVTLALQAIARIAAQYAPHKLAA